MPSTKSLPDTQTWSTLDKSLDYDGDAISLPPALSRNQSKSPQHYFGISSSDTGTSDLEECGANVEGLQLLRIESSKRHMPTNGQSLVCRRDDKSDGGDVFLPNKDNGATESQESEQSSTSKPKARVIVNGSPKREFLSSSSSSSVPSPPSLTPRQKSFGNGNPFYIESEPHQGSPQYTLKSGVKRVDYLSSITSSNDKLGMSFNSTAVTNKFVNTTQEQILSTVRESTEKQSYHQGLTFMPSQCKLMSMPSQFIVEEASNTDYQARDPNIPSELQFSPRHNRRLSNYMDNTEGSSTSLSNPIPSTYQDISELTSVQYETKSLRYICSEWRHNKTEAREASKRCLLDDDHTIESQSTLGALSVISALTGATTPHRVNNPGNKTPQVSGTLQQLVIDEQKQLFQEENVHANMEHKQTENIFERADDNYDTVNLRDSELVDESFISNNDNPEEHSTPYSLLPEEIPDTFANIQQTMTGDGPSLNIKPSNLNNTHSLFEVQSLPSESNIVHDTLLRKKSVHIDSHSVSDGSTKSDGLLLNQHRQQVHPLVQQRRLAIEAQHKRNKMMEAHSLRKQKPMSRPVTKPNPVVKSAINIFGISRTKSGDSLNSAKRSIASLKKLNPRTSLLGEAANKNKAPLRRDPYIPPVIKNDPVRIERESYLLGCGEGMEIFPRCDMEGQVEEGYFISPDIPPEAAVAAANAAAAAAALSPSEAKKGTRKKTREERWKPLSVDPKANVHLPSGAKPNPAANASPSDFSPIEQHNAFSPTQHQHFSSSASFNTTLSVKSNKAPPVGTFGVGSLQQLISAGLAFVRDDGCICLMDNLPIPQDYQQRRLLQISEGRNVGHASGVIFNEDDDEDEEDKGDWADPKRKKRWSALSDSATKKRDSSKRRKSNDIEMGQTPRTKNKSIAGSPDFRRSESSPPDIMRKPWTSPPSQDGNSKVQVKSGPHHNDDITVETQSTNRSCTSKTAACLGTFHAGTEIPMNDNRYMKRRIVRAWRTTQRIMARNPLGFHFLHMDRRRLKTIAIFILLPVWTYIWTILYSEIEGWTQFESFYFVIQIFTTVGFGDFKPITSNGMILFPIASLGGITLSAACIAHVAVYLSTTKSWVKVKNLIMIFFFFIAMSSFLFMWLENWSWWQSMFFLYNCATTTGLSEEVPKTIPGRMCFCFVMIVVFSIFTTLLKLLVDHMKQGSDAETMDSKDMSRSQMKAMIRNILENGA